MARKRNTSGGGAMTNKNGLAFEKRTSLLEDLKEIFPDFSEKMDTEEFREETKNVTYIKDNSIFNGKIKIGEVLQKYKLYKNFFEPRGIIWKDYLSKQLLPDDCFVNYKNRTAYIIEKKYQGGDGSVDEKIQTGGFKLWEYKKLFKAANFKVKFIYVLSNFFKKECYSDAFEFIKKSKCTYYFEKLDIDALKISKKPSSLIYKISSWIREYDFVNYIIQTIFSLILVFIFSAFLLERFSISFCEDMSTCYAIAIFLAGLIISIKIRILDTKIDYIPITFKRLYKEGIINNYTFRRNERNMLLIGVSFNVLLFFSIFALDNLTQYDIRILTNGLIFFDFVILIRNISILLRIFKIELAKNKCNSNN